jgi:hypothetical protein
MAQLREPAETERDRPTAVRLITHPGETLRLVLRDPRGNSLRFVRLIRLDNTERSNHGSEISDRPNHPKVPGALPHPNPFETAGQVCIVTSLWVVQRSACGLTTQAAFRIHRDAGRLRDASSGVAVQARCLMNSPPPAWTESRGGSDV